MTQLNAHGRGGESAIQGRGDGHVHLCSTLPARYLQATGMAAAPPLRRAAACWRPDLTARMPGSQHDDFMLGIYWVLLTGICVAVLLCVSREALGTHVHVLAALGAEHVQELYEEILPAEADAAQWMGVQPDSCSAR